MVVYEAYVLYKKLHSIFLKYGGCFHVPVAGNF